MHKRPLHTTIFCRLWNKKQFRSQAAVQVQTWRFPRPERHYCSYLKEKNKHRRKCAVFEQKETVTALTEASSREKSIKGICFIIFAQSSIKTPCCHTSWQLRGRKRKARLHLAGIICVGTKQQKAGIPKRNLSFFPHFFFSRVPSRIYIVIPIYLEGLHYLPVFSRKQQRFLALNVWLCPDINQPVHATIKPDTTLGVFASRVCGNMKLPKQRGCTPDFHGYLVIKNLSEGTDNSLLILACDLVKSWLWIHYTARPFPQTAQTDSSHPWLFCCCTELM